MRVKRGNAHARRLASPPGHLHMPACGMLSVPAVAATAGLHPDPFTAVV